MSCEYPDRVVENEGLTNFDRVVESMTGQAHEQSAHRLDETRSASIDYDANDVLAVVLDSNPAIDGRQFARYLDL